jgi:hypothetical protein
MGRGRNVLCVQVLTNGSGNHEYSGGALIVKLGHVLNGALVDISVLVLILKLGHVLNGALVDIFVLVLIVKLGHVLNGALVDIFVLSTV